MVDWFIPFSSSGERCPFAEEEELGARMVPNSH